MKITQQEFFEFINKFQQDVSKVPSYRVGQAFVNEYPEITGHPNPDLFHEKDGVKAIIRIISEFVEPITKDRGDEEQVPVRLPDGSLHQFMLKEAGKPYRCECGCNVFHKPDDQRLHIYECNSCGVRLKAE
jgi:hypothetical protein